MLKRMVLLVLGLAFALGLSPPMAWADAFSVSKDEESMMQWDLRKAIVAEYNTQPLDPAEQKAITERFGAIVEKLQTCYEVEFPKQFWVTFISTPIANAFNGLNGDVFVTKGFLDTFHPTDEELAFVIAHEMGHGIERHVARNIASYRRTHVLKEILGLLTDKKTLLDAVGFGREMQVLKFSREYEMAADEGAVKILAAAGIDPLAGAMVLRKFKTQRNGPEPPKFLSTHPPDDERIVQIEKLAPTVRVATAEEVEGKIKAKQTAKEQAYRERVERYNVEVEFDGPEAIKICQTGQSDRFALRKVKKDIFTFYVGTRPETADMLKSHKRNMLKALDGMEIWVFVQITERPPYKTVSWTMSYEKDKSPIWLAGEELGVPYGQAGRQVLLNGTCVTIHLTIRKQDFDSVEFRLGSPSLNELPPDDFQKWLSDPSKPPDSMKNLRFEDVRIEVFDKF